MLTHSIPSPLIFSSSGLEESADAKPAQVKGQTSISSTQSFRNHFLFFLLTAEVHVGQPGGGFGGPLERSVRSFPPAWTGEVGNTSCRGARLSSYRATALLVAALVHTD